MPPAHSSRERLQPEALAKLRTWIAQGARYEPHWAFIPPARPALPPTRHANPIDTLIEARRAAAGLRAAPEAPPETLARRLWLDLVGLPPSLAELDAFIVDYKARGEPAYVALVDRLLGSSAYGEKWARQWLDVARYADSDGYEKDFPRQQWAWRDWVIDALNRDKPYDQFIIEQIAGDLLMKPSHTLKERQDLLVATGFLRNSMVSEEGAIIPEQYRKEGMFDRMDCLGKAVLGFTLQCAQCHTHKFDPITHRDYYSLFSSIDNTYDARSHIYTAEQLVLIEKIQRGIDTEENRLKREVSDWDRRMEGWLAEQIASATPWKVVAPVEPTWSGGLSHPEALPDGSVITLGFRASDGQLAFTSKPVVARATGLRLEALTHGDLVFGGPGRNIDGIFAVSELVFETRAAGAKEWVKHPLHEAKADFESSERKLSPPFLKDDDDKRLLGPAVFLVDGKDDTAWSPDRGVGRRNTSVELIARFREPVTFSEDTEIRCTLRFKHSGKDGHGRHSQHLGRFRIALTDAAGAFSPPGRPDVRVARETPPERRNAAQQALLFSAWRENTTQFAKANAAIEDLWRTFPYTDRIVLHLLERLPEDARQTYILDRGAWDKPTDPVSFSTPRFLPEMREPAMPPRLQLARWLVNRSSPTASRVAVNRMWQAIYGAGLVETPEDFGIRANPPFHGGLLDWLAVEFMDRNWSQKALLRTIVTSATYRQSSRATPDLIEKDPRNRFLARGPRFRAEAEVVRDIALRTSGLLTEKLGGESIFPPVPESMFAESYLTVDFWKTATGSDRYRRSLYVFRRRSMPDPVLANFDAPNGDAACVARMRSNSPLAALTALNETVFFETAQALALRVLREGGTNDADRARYAFRLCTGRVPGSEEIADVLELLRAGRVRLVDGWVSARLVAFGEGEKLPALPAGTTPNDAAAWTIAARVLLNLDETLTKN